MKPEPKPQAPAPAAEQPKAEEPKKDNIFRPGHTQLAGPQILGTMDVSGMVPGGKHKRKRLEMLQSRATRRAARRIRRTSLHRVRLTSHSRTIRTSQSQARVVVIRRRRSTSQSQLFAQR